MVRVAFVAFVPAYIGGSSNLVFFLLPAKNEAPLSRTPVSGAYPNPSEKQIITLNNYYFKQLLLVE